MTFQLFDYCAQSGDNEFKAWTQGLQTAQRAKLNARLDKLKSHGDGLLPEMLSATDTPGILKLRIKGNVQLRPMLCRGPVNIGNEYTLLLGAIEVGGKLRPPKAAELADGLKTAVCEAPATRRTEHARVS